MASSSNHIHDDSVDNKNIQSFLASVYPLNQLPNNELKNIARSCRTVSHPKRSVIFTELDQAEGAWILMSGRVEIFKYTSMGRRTAIESITPREWMGTLCRLGTRCLNYPCTAIAAIDSTLVCIQESLFKNLLSNHPSLIQGFCSLCSQRLIAMQDVVASTLEPAGKRIVKTLFRLIQTNGLSLPFTKREISELSSTAPETTIRVLSFFQKKGWIMSSRGGITVKEGEKLRSYFDL